jgi:hypothetical protein
MLLKKQKQKQKQTKNKPNLLDRIRTLSVNLQGSRSSNYAITAMVQFTGDYLNFEMFKIFYLLGVY